MPIAFAETKSVDLGESPEAMRILPHFDRELLENRRLLAFKGLSVGQRSFTKRAFGFACWLFEEASKIEDNRLRAACRLFLTSTVAQLSRLIPRAHGLHRRARLSVPDSGRLRIHLESNPLVHLRARLVKFSRGIARLQRSPQNRTTVEVRCQDAREYLDELRGRGVLAGCDLSGSADGDSVPYLEFSSIWNAMLGEQVRYDQELVVSDRTQYKKGLEQYGQKLKLALQAATAVLSTPGVIFLTFNNLDMGVWRALLDGIEAAGLWCTKGAVSNQSPAVVSSRSKLAPEVSYAGDIYCRFVVKPTAGERQADVRPIVEAISCAVAGHGPRVGRTLLERVALLAILRENLAATTLDSIPAAIHSALASSASVDAALRRENGHGARTHCLLHLSTGTFLLQSGLCKMDHCLGANYSDLSSTRRMTWESRPNVLHANTCGGLFSSARRAVR